MLIQYIKFYRISDRSEVAYLNWTVIQFSTLGVRTVKRTFTQNRLGLIEITDAFFILHSVRFRSAIWL